MKSVIESEDMRLTIGAHTITVPASLVQEPAEIFPKTEIEKGDYTAVGKTSSLAAEPATVQFRGFQLGHVHEQSVALRNITRGAFRVHIFQPETKYFAIQFHKRGSIFPGLAEEIRVYFKPDAWRYYHDVIRVHAGSENLSIPLHAYPTHDPIELPKRIDFGECPTAERKTRTVHLSSSVPVDFEFTAEFRKRHIDVAVEPEGGVIPGEGRVSIDVSYAPSSFHTAHAVLRIRTSEFGAPFHDIEISGSSRPGILLENERNGEQAPSDAFVNSAPGVDFGRTSIDGRARRDHLGLRAARALQRDPFGTLQSRTGGRFAQLEASTTKLADQRAMGPSSPRGTSVRDALLGPGGLAAPQAVHRALAQDAHKEALRSARRELDENASATAAGQHAAEDDSSTVVGSAFGLLTSRLKGLDRFAKERLFAKQQRRIEEQEKAKELKWFECIGSSLVSEAERSAVVQSRHEEALAAEAAALRLARERSAVERDSQRVWAHEIALSIPKTVNRDIANPIGKEEAGNEQLRFPRSAKADLASGLPDLGAWEVRRRVLRRFQHGARTAMIQRRVDRRIAQLLQRSSLSSLITSEATVQVVQASSAIRKHGQEVSDDDASFAVCVVEPTLPQLAAEDFMDKLPMIVPRVPHYLEYVPHTFCAIPEFRIVGHDKEQTHPFPYITFPAETAPCVDADAPEESSQQLPRAKGGTASTLLSTMLSDEEIADLEAASPYSAVIPLHTPQDDDLVALAWSDFPVQQILARHAAGSTRESLRGAAIQADVLHTDIPSLLQTSEENREPEQRRSEELYFPLSTPPYTNIFVAETREAARRGLLRDTIRIEAGATPSSVRSQCKEPDRELGKGRVAFTSNPHAVIYSELTLYERALREEHAAQLGVVIPPHPPSSRGVFRGSSENHEHAHSSDHEKNGVHTESVHV